jgi:hypothetical protein
VAHEADPTWRDCANAGVEGREVQAVKIGHVARLVKSVDLPLPIEAVFVCRGYA